LLVCVTVVIGAATTAAISSFNTLSVIQQQDTSVKQQEKQDWILYFIQNRSLRLLSKVEGQYRNTVTNGLGVAGLSHIVCFVQFRCIQNKTRFSSKD
jgi:hypothetical protein